MFIAHIREDGTKQSVREHLENVSLLCAEACEKISLENLGRLIGLLHDMGKETEEFKSYIIYSFLHPEDKSQRGTVDHSTAGAKFIYKTYYRSKNPYEKLTAQIICLVICSHHGGLIDCIDLELRDKFTTRMNRDDLKINYYEATNNFFEDCCEMNEIHRLFMESVQEIKNILSRIRLVYDKKHFVKFAMAILVEFLLSCLIDADRYDTYAFMESKDLLDIENDIFKNCLWTGLSEHLNKKLDDLPKISKIDLLRNEISQSCKSFAKNKTGIYKLLVPTGGGKTLSSLRYALEHAREFKKDRIVYIIPFTTIIDQNSKEIKDFLDREDIILEHHSNLIMDNDSEEYKLLTERWDSPIILSTMVQFLNTLFNGGTQSVRRLHNLANSVVIFDEIQAIPIKCINMFNYAINFLSKICNTTVILCTATQPLLSNTEMPVLFEENSDIIPNAGEKFICFKRTDIIPKIQAGGYSIQELKELIFELMEGVNSTLIILNTKKAAKELFKAIDKENLLLPEDKKAIVFHLSTNMCPTHRIEALNKIREVLGKQKVICVSTQLIEAGVNISFECVVRSLAGLDSIAQAAGRCNRHAESSCGNVYVINMDASSENVSRFLEIKTGQDKTLRIFEEYNQNPEAFDCDLLSPKAIDKYFEYYFNELKLQMNYTLPKPYADKTMFDLLSENKQVVQDYIDRNQEKPDLMLYNSFKTAGDHFSVIDQNTVGIIVPYQKGEELIININGKCSIKNLKKYLKEAQLYSVNLYDQEYRNLNDLGAFMQLNNGGLIALKKEFYNESTGITTDNQQHEFLNY